MIRSFQLTDVAPLVLFLGRSPTNQARVWDRLSDTEADLASFFPLVMGNIVARDRHHSLVSSQRGAIRGLLCLRSRQGSSAWEIERLLVAQGHEESCLALLERLGAGQNGLLAGRVFLRVESGSHAVDLAKEAGFGQYLTEHLFRIGRATGNAPTEQAVGLRSKRSADDYGVFRLYSSAVHLQVRTVEGMTFEEWQQTRNRLPFREWVFEESGEIKAWMRVRADGAAGQFEIVADLAPSHLGSLMDHCLSLLNGKHPVYCLAGEFQQVLMAVLEER